MVKLVQMLCPKRHCIMVVAYLDGADNFVAVCNQMEDIVRTTPMNRWCGICGSRDLRFAETTTPWKTLAEAYPALKAGEALQIETRGFLDATGQSVEMCCDMERISETINRKIQSKS